MFQKIPTFACWSLVAVMVIISGLLMFGASRGDSAIVDELAHIPAGYSYVKYFDYRLNPEHPPLVKILAGLPLLFQKLNFPLETEEWKNGLNEEWEIGAKFLYENGNDADSIIFWSRFLPTLLTLAVIVLIYVFAKGLLGRWWAILPAFLFALSPTVLAHGHYVTTDIGAVFGFLLSLFLFLRFLSKPSPANLLWAGIGFGIAQLLKFSNFLLVPFFILLVAIFYLAGVWRDWKTTDVNRGRLRRFSIRLFRYCKSLLLIFLAGFILVYLVYAVLTINYPMEKQVSDTTKFLETFTPRILPEAVQWMSGVQVLRPLAEYFTGVLMVLQRATGGNTTYFLGEVSNVSWPYYFPAVYLLKEPIPVLVMLVFGFLLGFLGFLRTAIGVIFKKSSAFTEYLSLRFPEFSMLVFVVIYWMVSVNNNLNIGVRHLLPVMPFMYILTAAAFKKWFSIEEALLFKNVAVRVLVFTHELISFSFKSVTLAVLLLWFFISAIVVYPSYLSYFNIFGGGTGHGYRSVTDSNYDWGQDLKRLATWVKENGISKIAVDYFGGGSPKYYLAAEPHMVSVVEPWYSARGNPKEEADIEWLAVSINTIQGAKGQLTHGTRNPADEYSWLIDPYKPYARAGKSIFIYKL